MLDLNKRVEFKTLPIEIIEKDRLRFTSENVGPVPLNFTFSHLTVKARNKNSKKYKKYPLKGRLNLVTRRSHYNPGEKLILELICEPIDPAIESIIFEVFYFRYADAYSIGYFQYDFK